LALIGMKLALNALSGEQEKPDVPNASCCGEADAYWLDEIHVRDGKTCTTLPMIGPTSRAAVRVSAWRFLAQRLRRCAV
jgi:hypothetical protein